MVSLLFPIAIFLLFWLQLNAVKIILILVTDRWTGFLLMNIGETGNFISYAFAPASMVAPLGTVSVSSSPAIHEKAIDFLFLIFLIVRPNG